MYEEFGSYFRKIIKAHGFVAAEDSILACILPFLWVSSLWTRGVQHVSLL